MFECYLNENDDRIRAYLVSLNHVGNRKLCRSFILVWALDYHWNKKASEENRAVASEWTSMTAKCELILNFNCISNISFARTMFCLIQTYQRKNFECLAVRTARNRTVESEKLNCCVGRKRKSFFTFLSVRAKLTSPFEKKRFDFNLNCFWRSYSKCVRSLTQSRSRLSALLHFRHQWRSFRFKWFHRPFPFHFGVIFLLFYSSCRCLSLWRFLSNEIRGNSFFFCTFFSQPTDRAFNYKRIQCNINSLWCDFIGQCRVLFARHELVSI